ncbi:hypothetical protein SLH46_12210 [Draconibacterium sp. IB214405]|uniref:hypothetical protein n=1 Tax=Draconibacterium sp. IB214405 TaxID=3097352 RepID=UPI002A0D169D|nr:hypothetical protein [Draconibacterium sp. IB214405]MDX8339954.1 hypothetical protein [Draconibacterium sp. IB214405]
MPKRFRYILFLVGMVGWAFVSNAQKNDTISIRFDQLLMLKDTIYYGVDDSVVILNEGTEYDIIKNFLVRKPSYYEKHPDKIESVKRLNSRYGSLLMGSIRSKDEQLPKDFNPSDQYFAFYKNRIIKEITIERVPVLDGNLFDTTNVNISGFGRFLNKTYSPTRERVIRKNLHFKENDKVNARIFSDNERLFRELSYIEDAFIKITPLENSSDSVNVTVMVKDRYPIGVGGDVNDYNAFEVEPYSRNFGGLGHSIGIIGEFDGDTEEKFGYGAYYAINNMWGTFFDSEIRYQDGVDRENFMIQFEKPFLTTHTKNGGEVIYQRLREKVSEHPFSTDSLQNDNSRYHLTYFDLWLGHSFFFHSDITRSFLNFAMRYASFQYKNQPLIDESTNYQFHNRELYLAGLSLQRVSYIKTSRLLQYGTVEDVPIGYNLNTTAGWEETSYYDRLYAGLRANYSLYFNNAGIFSAYTEAGGYLNDSKLEDGLAGLRFDYLSPLGKLGDYEIRNIFELKLSTVRNPRYFIPYYSTRTFANEYLTGYKNYSNLSLYYRPVFYSSYQIWGFRFSFNPYFNIGWLGKSNAAKKEIDRYSQIGIWASTKNESLIFPAMHLQLGYFPNRLEQEPRFVFTIVFKDIKVFKDFTSLKPEAVNPARMF